MTPTVVVHPPSPSGGRRVTLASTILGLAHSREDVIEFLRGAGLDEAEHRLEDTDLVEWRGGGPDVWNPAA